MPWTGVRMAKKLEVVERIKRYVSGDIKESISNFAMIQCSFPTGCCLAGFYFQIKREGTIRWTPLIPALLPVATCCYLPQSKTREEK
jgi:hypothetical protein